MAALCTLPIAPSDWWKPADSDYPTARILALLAVCVGLPYFVLSSTGPLVQAWFSQTLPGRSPYRLYSLSNLGSLLALLSYPFVVEPLLDGHAQSLWWTAGFVLFCRCAARPAGKRPGCAGVRQRPPLWLRRRRRPSATATAGPLGAAAAVAGCCRPLPRCCCWPRPITFARMSLGPVSVGGAAEPVPVVVHHRLRSPALVSAAALWSGGVDRDLFDGRHVQPGVG